MESSLQRIDSGMLLSDGCDRHSSSATGLAHRPFTGPPRRVITSRVPTRETSLSSTALYSVHEGESEAQDLSTHGQLPDGFKDRVSGLLPFDQCAVKMLESEEALDVDFTQPFRTTKSSHLYAGTFSGQPITSKRLRTELCGNPMSLAYTALLLEAKALTALNLQLGHPGIPVLHGVSMHSTESPVLVLEPLLGPTLAAFLESKRSPIRFEQGTRTGRRSGDPVVSGGVWVAQRSLVFGWSIGLMSALAHLHERGVVHSDITTKNLVLTDDYTGIKVTSFENAVVKRHGHALNPGSERPSIDFSEPPAGPLGFGGQHCETSELAAGRGRAGGAHSPQNSCANGVGREGQAEKEGLFVGMGMRTSLSRRSLSRSRSPSIECPQRANLSVSLSTEDEGGEPGIPAEKAFLRMDKSPESVPGGGGHGSLVVELVEEADSIDRFAQAGDQGNAYVGAQIDDATLLAYSRDHFSRRSIEHMESRVMRARGDAATDVFQAALVIWEVSAGMCPQHPRAQTHLPPYVKRQNPISVMQETGFPFVVHYRLHEKFRPDSRFVKWRALRAVIEEAWQSDPQKRTTAAALLAKLTTLPGRPQLYTACGSEDACPGARCVCDSASCVLQ